MKMPNGGFSPAYNLQFASEPDSRVILGVAVTNPGAPGDSGQAEPMRQQVEQRTGGPVKEHLLDGGYLRLEEIDRAAEEGVALYVPPKPPRNKEKRRSAYEPRASDTPAQVEWRMRMGRPEGQAIYKQRAATSETIHADLRVHRGLDPGAPGLVRGLNQVRCVALWAALTYNLPTIFKLLVNQT